MAHKENSATKAAIIESATKHFIKSGFHNTTAKMICNDVGISPGNLTFWFPTKEDILLEFTSRIMGFHLRFIEESRQKYKNDLFVYCLEITTQIVLCEEHENIRDIYLSMYSAPRPMAYLKDWTAKKNLEVLGGYLPGWDLKRFRRAVNVTCCIERSAITEPCTDDYSLEDKIRLTLICLLKIYDIDKDTREKVIDEILSFDYGKVKKRLTKQMNEYIARFEA